MFRDIVKLSNGGFINIGESIVTDPILSLNFNSKTIIMKKCIIAAFLIAGSFGMVNAQIKEKARVTKATPVVTRTTTKVSTSEAKSAPTADIQKSVIRPTLKKEGTPDRRFKENKIAVKKTTVGPIKKDGTPDMRYNKNKVEKK